MLTAGKRHHSTVRIFKQNIWPYCHAITLHTAQRPMSSASQNSKLSLPVRRGSRESTWLIYTHTHPWRMPFTKRWIMYTEWCHPRVSTPLLAMRVAGRIFSRPSNLVQTGERLHWCQQILGHTCGCRLHTCTLNYAY